MYRLRLLGAFALERETGEAVDHLPQRRAEAVLAILAVAERRGCRREHLIELLWPDSDAELGHHSLRDALCVIRHALGTDAIVTDGGAVRLGATVATDVDAFARALASGRLAECVALYSGPLLEGFHLDLATQFEHWVDQERHRFARDCTHAAERLASGAEEQERWADAAEWWARAEALDPFCSPVVMRRMRALERAGDRANALLVGESHRQRMVDELEIAPTAEFMATLAAIRVGRSLDGDLGLHGKAMSTPAKPASRAVASKHK